MNQKPNKTLSKKQEGPKFDKYYRQLGHVFDNAEMAFVTKMSYVHFIASHGYNADWSKTFMITQMNMTIAVFNRCEKKFIEMKLLERRSVGKKICYTWNEELYVRLATIIDSSNDVFVVKDFYKAKFITEKKAIDEITDKEIALLKNAKRSKRKW